MRSMLGLKGAARICRSLEKAVLKIDGDGICISVRCRPTPRRSPSCPNVTGDVIDEQPDFDRDHSPFRKNCIDTDFAFAGPAAEDTFLNYYACNLRDSFGSFCVDDSARSLESDCFDLVNGRKRKEIVFDASPPADRRIS